MRYEKNIEKFFKDSKIAFTQQEIDSIDYADFGLNNIREEGLNLIVYINNERYCAKEMALLAGQTCPEHKHPRRGQNQEIEGKEETFRVRQGRVYLYVEGENNVAKISARLPERNKDLVMDCFLQACGKEHSQPGLIAHIDQGSQYTSSRYQSPPRQVGAQSSMSRKGILYDNAMMKFFCKTLRGNLLMMLILRQELRLPKKFLYILRPTTI